MDKVTDFLERHVQWVALGVAALFLAFAIYSYMPGLATPVAVSLSGSSEPFAPGAVDEHIQNTDAEPLDQRIVTPFTVQPIVVPKYATEVRDALTRPATNPALPAALVMARPVELPVVVWNAPEQQMGVADNKVRTLPTMPAPILEPATTGFAQVTPSAGAVGTGVVPVANPVGAAGAAGATVVAGQDQTWVRVPYLIPTQQMFAAFRAASLPNGWNQTTVLRVELVRQRQVGVDKWGPEEVVTPLPTVSLEPMPANGVANLAQQQQYLQWATANQAQIVQPTFFDVSAGDDPEVLPPPPVDPNAPKVFNPAEYPEGRSIVGLTPEQQQAVRDYREQQRRERAANRPQPPQRQPQQPRGGRGGGEGFTPALPPTDRRVNSPAPFQNRPGAPRNAPPAMAPGRAEGMPGEGMMPAAPVAGQPIVLTPVPTAPFAPSPELPDIQGVAYDITAIPDAVYRYRVRYMAQNPVFGSQNVTADPALAQVFALVGEDANAWTAPITIAPLTHIFLAQSPSGAIVKFNVFRWQGGKWQSAQVNASSGDSVGRVDNNVDYRTQWTLVEWRRDTSASQPYAVVMNADGSLRRHTFEEDQANPLQQRLRTEVEANAAASANANATGAGAPTGAPPAGGRGGRPAAGAGGGQVQ